MEVKELNTDRIEEIKEAMTAIFSVEPWNDVWNSSMPMSWKSSETGIPCLSGSMRAAA